MGPAWPRTSALTLSMSDSQSCQSFTGLMIVGQLAKSPRAQGKCGHCPPAHCSLAQGSAGATGCTP